MDIRNIKERNAAIAEMLGDDEKIKDFYRFVAINPHISLHDACQIIIQKQTAGVCYSFDEWNAIGRRINAGSHGIPYYDEKSNKHFVFDVGNTNDVSEYERKAVSLKQILVGLDVLNDSKLEKDNTYSDYDKIFFGIQALFSTDDTYFDDTINFQYKCEGVAYSLYCMTAFPVFDDIRLNGLPHGLKENAKVFAEIRAVTDNVCAEILAAAERGKVTVVHDTDVDVITDEPVVSSAENKQSIVNIHNAIYSNYKDYCAFVRYPNIYDSSVNEVYLGKTANYDDEGNYDNSDNSLVFISDNDKMFYFLSGEGWTQSQKELVEDGYFTDDDYREFNDLKNGLLKQFECTREIKFSINNDVKGSGVPFTYPDWDKTETQPTEEQIMPSHAEVELRREIEELMDEQSENDYADSDETEDNDESLDDDYEDDEFDESEEIDEDDDWESEIENAVEIDDEEKPTKKKTTEKGIRDRRKKPSAQPSFFDVLAPKQKTPEEELTEYVLKQGGRVEGGKFRIYDKYLTNPTAKEFASFLSKEYGIGGYYSGEYEESHDGKGIRFAKRDKNDPENDIAILLNWNQVANGIADLIDTDNYFTEKERQAYDTLIAKRNERINTKTDADRIKVIVRQGIEVATKRTWTGEYEIQPYIFEESAQFAREHRSEIEQAFLNEKEVIGSKPTAFPYADNILIILDPKYCERLKSDTDSERINKVVEYIVKTGTNNTSSGDYIFTPSELPEDALFINEHKEELEIALAKREEVSDVEWDDNEIFVDYYLNYCHNLDDDVIDDAYGDDGNTDLNAIGFDQTELGGQKSKFKSNIEAIRLLKDLEFSRRAATPMERKTLAKYVGWGGLSEAFDESNEKWSNEYKELKDLLTSDEYDRAKANVNNSHFTSKEVIDGIYRALDRLGVKSGIKILEPSMGTGNFFGYMPKSISDGSKLYGVEIDDITGRIAQKLYPETNIQIKGFETTSFTDESMDLVIGNVPFGNYGVFDTPYNRYNFLIHDYFIAKGLDKLKPGGIMAVITSKGTLDKLNASARKYMAQRAELIGAMRLPNTAFKTADTEAVTDVLFFRKREEKLNDVSEVGWLGTYRTGDGYDINNYFADRPDMVLGKPVMATGLYGAEDLTVEPDGRSLADAMNAAIERLPQNVFAPVSKSDELDEGDIEADYTVRPLCYKTQNGKLYMRIADRMQIQPMPKNPKDAYARISDMIVLRNKLREILQMQTEGCSDEQLRSAQSELNYKYDTFVRRYGYLNGSTNKRLFGDDGDSALLFACENWDDNKKTATKGDIFNKRTIRPYTVITQTDDCFEALQISKNERGKVDIRYIEELTKKDKATVLYELGDAVFRNPEKVTDDEYSGYETSEEYLSGNVVRKLQIAKNLVASGNAAYARNAAALEKVQPEPIRAQDIAVRLGSSWVDKKYYEQFLCELLNVYSYYSDGISITYNPFDNSWKVSRTDYIRNSTRMKAYEVFGTTRASAFRLMEDCLNQRATNIYDTVEIDGKERQVLNQAETIAAREKQNKIKELFKDWIFADPERRDELERTYNSLFNQLRLPSYDGSYLRFPGMNPAIELRPHQKNAVHRIITSGNTLLHHVVGSGKTYTCIASIMKQRQYGLIQKAMVAVPNHLVQQWADDWRKLYPNAKILVASKEDLSKDKRQQFVSRVAMGDWDGIIIAQSSFGKIGISKDRQETKIREEIASIVQAIDATTDTNGSRSVAVKRLESIKKQREVKLKKLLDESKKDDVLIFESLGVDALYIDEAHNYKNLLLYTKMNNVAGLSNAASGRASDLQLKVEYINELHGGDKGVVFATGTPISNSMSEMYTMQTYLSKNTLRELGITFFDSWAADFGETMTTLEMAPSGQGYKPRTRFSKFTNLPELLTLYRSFADVQTSEQVKLDVPEAEKKVVTLKPSDTVVELAEEIAERAERIYGGGVDPHEDNMLKVTTDGKKLALDPRCLDPQLPSEPDSKINACAARVYEIWQRTKDFKGTQLIFCDKSTPQCKFEEYVPGENFDAYNELKYKLVEMGIPQNEIAYIHDAETDNAKQALFAAVNSGRVRVLLGSTEKCGAGTNAQERLFALHHLDTPYRPSDLAQREGRIIRQGNTNKNVEIYTYVTERTFDSYSYQILENKQRFIAQIDRGDLTVREADDIDETMLTYAEIKAITAANPRIKRKMELDTEVARLRVLEGQYKKNKYALQDKVRKEYPERIRKQELYIERLRKDMQTVKDSYDAENFKISVNGTSYTDRKEGGKALTDALYASKLGTVVAEYGGLKISMNPINSLMDAVRTATIEGAGQYVIEVGASSSGNLVRLDNFLKDFDKKEEAAVKRLEQIRSDAEIAKQQAEVPFEHKDRLKELADELIEINAELDLNHREVTTQVVDDESGDGDSFMAVDYESRTVAASTHLKDTAIKIYSKAKRDDPNTVVIVRNGSDYEMLGAEAKDYAESKGLAYMTEQVKDATVHILPIKATELDNIVAELHEQGKTVTIDEPEIDHREDNFLEEHDVIEKDYELETKYGYEVVSLFTDGDRKHAIFHRQSDDSYGFAIGYDTETGEWKQGRYDYATYYNAYMDLKAGEVLSVLKPKSKTYRQAVAESVKREYDDFCAEEAQKDISEVIRDDGAMLHFYTELNDFLSESEHDLSDRDLQALFEDSPYIIAELFRHYNKNEYASINSYEYISDMIVSYNDKYYADIVRDRHEFKDGESKYYLGTDTENAAYYAFDDGLSRAELSRIEHKADVYVVAAPACYMVQSELDDKHIFFLKIGRDITEAELKGDAPIYAMQSAVSRVQEERRKDYLAMLGRHTEVKNAIDSGIRNNFDGMRLNDGFVTELVDEYGLDEVKYVLANTLQLNDYDGRYSPKHIDLAREIKITENDGHRRQFSLGSHPAIIDGLAAIVFEKQTTKQEDSMPQNEEAKTKWTRVRVPQEAVIGKYTKNMFMRMPDGEYGDYTYNVFNNRVREVPDNEIENGLKYVLLFTDSDTVRLRTRDGDEVELSPDEFKALVDGETSESYPKAKTVSAWRKFNIPARAEVTVKEKSGKFVMPDNGKYAGMVYFIPNAFIEGAFMADNGTEHIAINIPGDLKVTLYGEDNIKTEMTAQELCEIVGSTTPDMYSDASIERARNMTPSDSGWRHVDVDGAAVIARYEKRTLFKMPSGVNHDGYAYYIPNGQLKSNDDGSIRINIPPEFEVELTKVEEDGKTVVPTDEFIVEVQGKTRESYISEYAMPGHWADVFTKEREDKLRNNIPDEMKSRPNWIIVRTRDNPQKGHKDKFLISPVTGHGADISDPSTWTDFETACKCAQENGGETLAYALDGKDGICCIDLDKCMESNGDMLPLAKNVWETARGSYSEKSISGNGLHVFGKTEGMDLRTFSKDGTLEFYQRSHFIALTGDDFGSRELKSFDTPEMKAILTSKCDKRAAWNGVGQGKEGLSYMSDRDIVEKASTNKKNGDLFTRLYNGEDVRGNHSNSDMALMNMLAFWCNGDKEQMLRIFATSGLFRFEKHASYYECTAMKAIRDIPNRYVPKTPTAPKKLNTGNKGGK